MQSWDYDLLPPAQRPPRSPAQLLDARVRLAYEMVELGMQDLPRDTPPDTAILLAHMLDLGATLCQHTRRDVEADDRDLGYDEEATC